MTCCDNNQNHIRIGEAETQIVLFVTQSILFDQNRSKIILALKIEGRL